MADIDRRGSRWLARYRDKGGVQRGKTFDRKIDAELFLARMATARASGSYVDPRAGAVPLREYAERWLAGRLHLRRASAELYRQHLDRWILPALGDYRLGAISRADCASFVAMLDRELAASTVHTVYSVLRAVMQGAVLDELIPANPCSGVKLPRIEKRVLAPLPASAVLALAAAITPRFELAVWLAAGAGLREGEALGLTTAYVDFMRRTVHVVQQMQNRELVAPKTDASRRVIPVDSLVLEKISAHMKLWPPGEHGVLVTNQIGRPVTRSGFGDCWRAAVAAAGLPAGTRFHDLRHYYASVLIHANLNPKVIQARLGHASITETMDCYGHLFPEAADLGRGAIDAALGAAQYTSSSLQDSSHQ